MRGSSRSFLPTTGVVLVLAVTTLMTPARIPALSARIAIAEVVMGVSREGFTIMVHLAARAVSISRKSMTMGKFQLGNSEKGPSQSERMYGPVQTGKGDRQAR
jgi:hypothetical protein